MKKTLHLLPLMLLLASCLREQELKRPFITFEPVLLDDGWEISSPEAENMNTLELTDIFRDFHADESLWQVRSLLVFRNGKLVAESYTKDDKDISTPRAIWSCTKQVVGILTGIALEHQIIQSIEDSIGAYLPETSQYTDKKSIRIRHLLTMSSGLAYSNDGLSGQTDDILRQLPDNIISFILGRPLNAVPGEMVQYKDCDPQLVTAVIQYGSGKPASEWAREVLFDPLEIKNLKWQHYKDGITLGGFGIMTTPREMAKFGQCVADSGTWKGHAVVSKEWIREMTAVKVDDMYSYQFGYLWWKDGKRNMTFMSGHGGQYACIVPSKRLLVVMTSEANTQGDAQFGKEAFDWVDRIVQTAD